jgi:hypothetical protein
MPLYNFSCANAADPPGDQRQCDDVGVDAGLGWQSQHDHHAEFPRAGSGRYIRLPDGAQLDFLRAVSRGAQPN